MSSHNFPSHHPITPSPHHPSSPTLKPTDDGSYTFFSQEFEELYHSHSGAKQEAEYKFVEPCQLKNKAQIKSSLKILDICYGLGYNSSAALATIWSVNPNCQVKLMALEKDETVSRQAIFHQLLTHWPAPVPSYLETLAQSHYIQSSSSLYPLTAKLWVEDARISLKALVNSGFKADAIFLDPFSPPKCPQLWTVEFIALVAQCLKPDGYLATYSCAACIRKALQLTGLSLEATRGVGRRSPGTLASWKNQDHLALSEQEWEHLQTRAAIPYRDPQLEDTAIMIHNRREKEQQESSLEPSSHWKKRWIKTRDKSD
ncbi:tRNA (5-methylaminomethyl-2-thiouridine)(34)-methyltransferase MnmD [Aphanothece sacrum]|uniref:SAM-dependent methyltransferase n=1 Tax=Aphanothece sacrum FPU1 TaxID=1920663 RepID=A0A401IC47_APHSA|nr:MnmC family methyltransferase [Aphanothece sacrum]GBF78825.1 SAM-dependent methyltransferase [Aphanothece sacrum FPU1]GBF83057.1 SAM-dependent methyltransferase [Aphanothece sacrum FPU3]